LVLGNTAEYLLHRLGWSVLARKPSGFVSPVAPVDGRAASNPEGRP
jgi:hypothetical protein